MGKVKIPSAAPTDDPFTRMQVTQNAAMRAAEQAHKASGRALQNIAHEVQAATDRLTNAVVKQRLAIATHNETARALRAATEKAYRPR